MTEGAVQEAGPARLVVDVDAGARLASLEVFGHELLVTSDDAITGWGSYPMAPFAGRVRRGRFSFEGRDYRLPINFGSHAIHGMAFDRPWTAVTSTDFVIALDSRWPFPGEVRQSVVLAEDALSLRLEVHAAEGPMPASCGWHPWFRRRLRDGTSAQLDFEAEFIEVKDDEGIPSGERTAPPLGPWDDCFGGLAGPARITWPGVLELELESDAQYLVVYDEREYAVCVEPQTSPPDSFNRDPEIVEPGRPLVVTSTWRWSSLTDVG